MRTYLHYSPVECIGIAPILAVLETDVLLLTLTLRGAGLGKCAPLTRLEIWLIADYDYPAFGVGKGNRTPDTTLAT